MCVCVCVCVGVDVWVCASRDCHKTEAASPISWLCHLVSTVLGCDGFPPVFWSVGLEQVQWNKLTKHLTVWMREGGGGGGGGRGEEVHV